MNGSRKWRELFPAAQFVISHPNGWGGEEQSKLRRIAVRAGLVEDTLAGRARVHFVTEAEASVHFCLNQGLVEEAIKVRSGSPYPCPRLMQARIMEGPSLLPTWEAEHLTSRPIKCQSANLCAYERLPRHDASSPHIFS